MKKAFQLAIRGFLRNAKSSNYKKNNYRSAECISSKHLPINKIQI